jgi:hypothetical protein
MISLTLRLPLLLGNNTSISSLVLNMKEKMYFNAQTAIVVIRPYLIGNTLRLRYKAQPVNAVWGNSRCLL